MPDSLVDYLRKEGLQLLEDEKVRSAVIEAGANALPLPNFIERRILGIIYGALVEAVKTRL